MNSVTTATRAMPKHAKAPGSEESRADAPHAAAHAITRARAHQPTVTNGAQRRGSGRVGTTSTHAANGNQAAMTATAVSVSGTAAHTPPALINTTAVSPRSFRDRARIDQPTPAPTPSTATLIAAPVVTSSNNPRRTPRATYMATKPAAAATRRTAARDHPGRRAVASMPMPVATAPTVRP